MMATSRGSTASARRGGDASLADVTNRSDKVSPRRLQEQKIESNDKHSDSVAPASKPSEAFVRATEAVKEIAEQVRGGKLLESQSAVQSYSDRVAKRQRRSTQPQSSDDVQAALSGIIGEQDALQPSWDAFKTWPRGLEEEEKAIGDYFRRLKMIQLEQETRSIFVHDTNDDTQTVYTLSEVRQLEAEVRELKAQLQARKQKAREMRGDIEGMAVEFVRFDRLQAEVAEASALATQIRDAELELARLNAVGGTDGREDNSTAPPRLGTFTRDEADDILNNQLLAMESLETNHTNTLKAIESAKRQLASSMQTLDRLNAERSATEKAAREAQAGTRQQRNHTLEAVCRGYTATSKLLFGVLGLRSLDAPDERSLRAVYVVCDTRARAFCEEVAIELHFDRLHGDRLDGFTLDTPSGRSLTDRLAPPGSHSRHQMALAVRANDASLLLHEALLCIESASPNE